MSRSSAHACGALAVIAGGLILTAAPAVAQDVHAAWLKKPSVDDLMGVWPAAVAKTGDGGSARINCVVTVQGTLRDCRVVAEAPDGGGFGQAGLALAPQFLFKPATKNGVPVEEPISIPVKWSGQSPSGNDPIRIISNVAWSRAPSVEEVMAAYPAKAKAANVEGHATLDCTFGASGGLYGCAVLREEPRGDGFGAAARKLANRFIGPTVDGAGKSLSGAHTQLPFVFVAAGDDAAIGRPQWTALPKAQDLIDAFPKDALKVGVRKGRVVMHCTIGPAGELAGCEVSSEDPPGYGLGKATVGLAGTFRLSLWSSEGLPTIGGTVNIPIRFDLSELAAAPKP